jgi:hypothetical protein
LKVLVRVKCYAPENIMYFFIGAFIRKPPNLRLAVRVFFGFSLPKCGSLLRLYLPSGSYPPLAGFSINCFFV